MILTLEELTRETNVILGKPDTNIAQYSLHISSSRANVCSKDEKKGKEECKSHDTTVIVSGNAEYEFGT